MSRRLSFWYGLLRWFGLFGRIQELSFKRIDEINKRSYSTFRDALGKKAVGHVIVDTRNYAKFDSKVRTTSVLLESAVAIYWNGTNNELCWLRTSSVGLAWWWRII